MRYVDLRVRPDERWFHPVYRCLAEDPDLRPGPIRNVNRLDDGTIVLLYEVAGPKDRVDAILEEHGTGMKRDTTEAGRTTLVWAHLDPADDTTATVVTDLLDVTDTYSVVVDTPIEVTADGELAVTLIGESGVIRTLFEDAPERAHVTVEKTGTYRPETDRLFAGLTARQQEVLLAAIETGYYDAPRRATYDDVAAAVGCSATTVGEHLRKIERQFVREIAPTDDGSTVGSR
jgi:predicted DNA binding protein